MKMRESATPADQQRVSTMMAQRRTLNPNMRRATAAGGGLGRGVVNTASAPAPAGAAVATPKPAWQQLREQGISGQGSAAANKAAAAGLNAAPPSGPTMMPTDPMGPPGGGMARQIMPAGMPPGPGGPGGGMMAIENQDPSGGRGFIPPDVNPLQSAIGDGPGQVPPGVPGLPPEIMERLKSMRMAGAGPGAQQAGGIPDPSGGRGFVPPGQGASGAAPRPYGLQSFYGA